LLLTCLLGTKGARAQILVYSFTGNTTSATSVNSSIAASAISTNGTISVSNSSPVSSGYTGATGSFYGTDNGWGSAGNYFQFTITPNANERVSITSINLGYRTSSTSGPNALAVKSSADGYTSSLAVGSLTNADTSWHSLGATSVTLTFTSATTFRIYASGAATNTPTWRMDDLTINGSVSAIPEPSTYALGVSTLVFLAALRRRRSALGPDSHARHAREANDGAPPRG